MAKRSKAPEGHDPSDPAEAPGDDVSFIDVGYVWTPSTEFPAYLRQVREAAGLTVRAAAKVIGISHVYLVRLENAGPARSPNVRRLFAMADLYGVDRREMLNRAGIRTDLPPEVDVDARVDERFAALVLAPELRAALINEEALHWIPPRLKQQWIEFARRLARQPDPEALLARLIGEEP